MVEYIKETNEVVISKNDYLKLDTGYYKYIGKVKTLMEVPNTNCLYSMDGLLYIRRVNLQKLQALKNIHKPIKETDDSDELDLEVKPGDDSTLVIVKELLKGFTKNMFRKLFDNDSDMNNMRRAIEKSPNGEISLKRFKIMLSKLGIKYKIIVFSDDLDTAPKFDMDAKIKRINAEELSINDRLPEESESDSDDEE